MIVVRLVLLVVMVVGWLVIPALPGFAVDQPEPGISSAVVEQPQSIRSSLGAENISSEKVNQFINAYLQVVDLIEQREGALQGAETDPDSLRIQQEIETEAFTIIENAGLTWQEYLQLLGLANTDPEFGERIAVQLQEAGQ